MAIAGKGLVKGLGMIVMALGFFILINIAMLTRIYVNYYRPLEQSMVEQIGFIWLRLAFEPLSGMIMGVILVIIGIGLVRLRNWARPLAFGLMSANFFAMASWIFFTQFKYVSAGRVIQVFAMYLLITIFLSLKGVRSLLT